MTFKIGVLISGNGSNLQALIDHSGNTYEITYVISNCATALGIRRAKNADIPVYVFLRKDYESRKAFDQALFAWLLAHPVDLIALAGFMHLLATSLVEHYRYRMLNIHPSLLPQFTGLNTHQRVLDAGHLRHGASIHWVIPKLDAGEVIMQAEVPVNQGDSPAILGQRVLSKEHLIYPYVVTLLSNKRLQVIDDKMYLDKKLLTKPILYKDNQ